MADSPSERDIRDPGLAEEHHDETRPGANETS